MLSSLSQIENSLERGAVGISELLSLRRELQSPFKLHPLGFMACTLMIDGPRRLRLHYWPVVGGAQQSPECQIHDHIFEFKSWVLSGAVENVEYSASEHGAELAVYRTEYLDDQSILTKTSATLKVVETGRCVYSAGSCYEVPTGRLHETVRLGATPACTVLLTNDASEEAPVVLGPLAGRSRYVYHRQVVPEISVARILGTTPV